MGRSPAVILAVTLLAPSLAVAQTPSPTPVAPGEAAAVQRAAQEAAEDLLLKRVIAGLQLTDSQLRELLPLLQDAQTRLQALDRKNGESIASNKPALTEARNQLLAGRVISPRAEGQYAEALQVAAAKRAQLHADLVSSLKRALTGQLGSQQAALLLQTARSVGLQERTAGYRAEAMAASVAGVGGNNRMGQMMDRIRQMPPEDFQRMQSRVSGSQGQRGATAQDAQRRMELMAAIRALPPDTYQVQRDTLALQLFDQRSRGGLGSTPSDSQAELDAFIDRYFLSPRIVPVVQQRLSGGADRGAANRE